MSTSHVSPVWFQVTDLAVVSGSGAVVTTTDGTDYLDFTAGIAVASTGHCHPHVVAAIQEQAARFVHAQVNCYRHDLLEPLSARLVELHHPGIEQVFLANSGAEATEAAVKLARAATGRPNVIVFAGSFHGRTAQAMAMTTSKTAYRAGYQPLPSGVFVAPFPYTVWTGEPLEEATDRCLRELRLLLQTQTAPTETAAVIIEPVLGEGGYVPAPAAFLRGVEAVCRQHDLLFIADEVQSGFLRTGVMFSYQHAGVEPDIVVMAKGIASGFPLSAIGASADLMSRWPVGSHGGTYGGNPIGCAAALATLDVLTEPGFAEHVKARGLQLWEGLRALQQRDPGLVDVRGPGLMVATEFADPTGEPDAGRVARIARHCLDEGRLILMNAGTFGSTLRWMPPLVVTREEIDRGLAAFADALAATAPGS